MRIAIAAGLFLLIALLAGAKFFRSSIHWSSASSVANAEAEILEVEVPSVEGKRSPVIVELFTSEGCSSCPPADKVLAELESGQPVAGAEIIALSEHVDYWNYIGWSDPFSSEAFSARQGAYASVFNNDGVYTPQMVVDGQAEFIGSNSEKARTAIARLAKIPKAEVTIDSAQAETPSTVKLKVNVAKLPKLSTDDIAEVLLAITETNISSQVVRGENIGQKLNHTAIVRELRSLGSVASSTKPFETETTVRLGKDWKRGNLKAVAFIQERKQKRILGAALVNLAER